MDFFANISDRFYLNFIKDDRWMYITEGLKVTLTVTFFSVLIGIVLGFIIALIRATYDRTGKKIFRWDGFGDFILWFFNCIAKLYLTVIRGTPVVVQLLIIYFVIFASVDVDKVVVAVIAFGINSAAYVAEIFRGGIMSIDNGQFEAGRSLGFSYFQTMRYIVIPQTIKSTLPTLLNELIALFKETSIAGYVGILDLTKAGERIRGITFEAFMPLIAVAIVYLLTVILLTKMVAIIERRLRRNER